MKKNDINKPILGVTKRFEQSCIKAKKLGIIINWSNPQRHVDDDVLRFVFRKLGCNIVMQEYPIPLTVEEFMYCLDTIGVLQDK